MMIRLKSEIWNEKDDFLVVVSNFSYIYSVGSMGRVIEDYYLNNLHITRKKRCLRKIGDGVYERKFFKFLKWFEL